MYSDWQAEAQKAIARLMADVPADLDWKERQKILRKAAHSFHGGTSWGQRVWAKHCKAYLARHGKPQPAKETPLFAPDIAFPFREAPPPPPKRKDELMDDLKELACGWCGREYTEGQHFYDDTCNPCARQHGLEVPKDWRPTELRARLQQGEGDEPAR